ncbi:MAG: primosomal protein N' [bacterium]|nr:primosomal protein N' [bacterium]
MHSRKRLASVAVTGPFRRTFTYHLPEDLDVPALGQRVLVEFGRSRTVGFYLGEPSAQPGMTTKPIVKALDDTSFFPTDLYRLCLWMADYYFANPADCLASALPPLLKTRRSVQLRWSNTLPESVTVDPGNIFRPGKILTSAALAELRKASGTSVPELVKSEVLVEQWPLGDAGNKTVIAGYRTANPEIWTEFYQRKRFKPSTFGGVLGPDALKEEGWTDHYLRQAVAGGTLEPVISDRPDRILDFVRPKEGVNELRLFKQQQEAVDRVAQHLDKGFQSFLLHGITGSGKTLVYCHLARQALRNNGTVLVLTPEIALSGATLAYFRGFFGDQVTVIHSAMSQRERLESWNGIRKGRYRIVVGPRSAIFAPLENLALIVVDEEHDGSYKQDDPAPRFNGRDSAIMRAQINDIPVLLGSASPSIESYHNVRTGRYQLLKLTQRPAGAVLPLVRVVDMRKQKLHGDLPYMSFPLKKEVDARFELDQQVILFLNRRGYSPQLKCAECGHVPSCPQCDVKLTYHKTGGKLSCHFCGHISLSVDKCPKCGSSDFQYPGAGTQKVEEHIARLFPDGRALRFDSDTASGRKNSHQMLKMFAERKYNLLLGTQMVTKGLDLPGVSLVGVLSADQGLDLPDFRASEKTFSRLLQVAGRSGRGETAGDVVIQTYYPDSEVIQDAARQDYESFYEREVLSRQVHNFPPFSRMVKFVFSGKDPDKLPAHTEQFGLELKKEAAAASLEINLLGPAPCPHAYLRGNHRRQLFAVTRQPLKLTRLLYNWENRRTRFGLPSNVKLVVDVDPDDMI